VIAIIGILAAMVFPVFARARESARKAVCLSNVKNIALAIQMYLADNNDTLPPREHRAEVNDYFSSVPGGEADEDLSGESDIWCANQANPYLRWPVILEEYVKNRDVWMCPSARIIGGATWIMPDPDWFRYVKSTEGSWGFLADYNWGPCYHSFPQGWGGEITDTIAQGRMAVPQLGFIGGTGVANKAFAMGLGLIEGENRGLKLAAVQDPVSHIICGDGGGEFFDMPLGVMAYPDICSIDCSQPCNCGPDWEICTGDAESDGCVSCILLHAPNNGSFLKDPSLRKPYARHLGGVNLGFLDGHAAWLLSDLLIRKVAEGDLRGVDTWGPTSDCGFLEDYPDYPVIY